MLEEMSAFFEKRLSDYDVHMLTDIEGANEFYAFTAAQLPRQPKAEVLDLGCGTGLELEAYFLCDPDAHVTGIDLSQGMLNALAAKFPDKKLNLICASYFDVEFGTAQYHAAVSVESLHHFTAERKLPLYQKALRALRPDGCFVLTDYFAESDVPEKEFFATFEKLKQEQGISDNVFYHYDTPLTVEHETGVLRKAGFSEVRILRNWKATYTLLAKR